MSTEWQSTRETRWVVLIARRKFLADSSNTNIGLHVKMFGKEDLIVVGNLTGNFSIAKITV